MKKIITETEITTAKSEVLRAALGICALEETDLFLRLEEIYWRDSRPRWNAWRTAIRLATTMQCIPIRRV